jgi:hypothetical protein
VESKLDPLGTWAIYWPIVPAPGDCEDGEFGGMTIGRESRSTRRKPAPAPLCPRQIPLDQTRGRTRAAVVGSQRLTVWVMAQPSKEVKYHGYENKRVRFRAFVISVMKHGAAVARLRDAQWRHKAPSTGKHHASLCCGYHPWYVIGCFRVRISTSRPGCPEFLCFC